ncbi:MAG: hypothetical protein QOC88_3298 [Mycobacterium sp.]|nr:hypothetical protein [Mycobacterium sp.]
MIDYSSSSSEWNCGYAVLAADGDLFDRSADRWTCSLCAMQYGERAALLARANRYYVC